MPSDPREGDATSDPHDSRSRVSIEVKTTGMIVVIFLVLIVVFSRQLDHDQLLRLIVALARPSRS